MYEIDHHEDNKNEVTEIKIKVIVATHRVFMQYSKISIFVCAQWLGNGLTLMLYLADSLALS